MTRWERFKAWRARRRHDALRAYQRSQGLYIIDRYETPIARGMAPGVGGLSPAKLPRDSMALSAPPMSVRLDDDRPAVIYALSTIAGWEEWGSTGGPSLGDAANLILERVQEARDERASRPGTRMDMIGADMEPDLGARKAARKWASSEKAADERPHLSGLILRLCDEHEQMERSLRKIAAEESPSDPWAQREAGSGLQGIQ